MPMLMERHPMAGTCTDARDRAGGSHPDPETLIGPVLQMFTGLASVSVVSSLGQMSTRDGIPWRMTTELGGFLATTLTGCLLLAVAYHRLVPGVRPSFRRVVPGAALAAVSWTVVSLGFSLALSTVLDYGTTYGSFGAAIALLVYLQLSAIVVLAGAEVNAVLPAYRSLARERSP